MKEGLYQEMSENKSIPQEKYLTKTSKKISTKHSQKVFHQQILKRNSHKQKKISEEKSLPNKIQIETSTTKYLTAQISTKIIEGEFSTK